MDIRMTFGRSERSLRLERTGLPQSASAGRSPEASPDPLCFVSRIKRTLEPCHVDRSTSWSNQRLGRARPTTPAKTSSGLPPASRYRWNSTAAPRPGASNVNTPIPNRSTGSFGTSTSNARREGIGGTKLRRVSSAIVIDVASCNPLRSGNSRPTSSAWSTKKYREELGGSPSPQPLSKKSARAAAQASHRMATSSFIMRRASIAHGLDGLAVLNNC